MIPALGNLAFDSRINPEYLFGLASTAPPVPEAEEAAEALFGFAADLVTILTLPEVER